MSHIQDIALLKEKNKSSSLRIEAYDIAHLSEKNRVGVMVVVDGDVADTSQYRKFNIHQDGGGDTGALKEVLRRRFKHTEWSFPSLVVVDGGKAQQNVAKKVLQEFGFQIA